jgi:hypothetical protein
MKTDHMKMKNPEDDVWLSPNGEGYFVPNGSFEKHLETAIKIKEVNRHLCCDLVSKLNPFQTPKCVNHKANKETTCCHKNIDINGTLACACAAHGCVVPGSMVNMYHGERYVICTICGIVCVDNGVMFKASIQ